jgi:uncharacterized protein (UPF0147 family)
MDLERYLEENEMKQADFARKMSVLTKKSAEACAVVVSRIIKDDHIPRSNYIRAVAELTGGKVTANSFHKIFLRSEP